jgi:hypothetical protein
VLLLEFDELQVVEIADDLAKRIRREHPGVQIEIMPLLYLRHCMEGILQAMHRLQRSPMPLVPGDLAALPPHLQKKYSVAVPAEWLVDCVWATSMTRPRELFSRSQSKQYHLSGTASASSPPGARINGASRPSRRRGSAAPDAEI